MKACPLIVLFVFKGRRVRLLCLQSDEALCQEEIQPWENHHPTKRSRPHASIESIVVVAVVMVMMIIMAAEATATTTMIQR